MWDRGSLRDSDLGAAMHHKGLQTHGSTWGDRRSPDWSFSVCWRAPGPWREVSRMGHLLCARTPRPLCVTRSGGGNEASLPHRSMTPWGDLAFPHVSFRVWKAFPAFYPGGRLGSLPKPKMSREHSIHIRGTSGCYTSSWSLKIVSWGWGGGNSGILYCCPWHHHYQLFCIIDCASQISQKPQGRNSSEAG